MKRYLCRLAEQLEYILTNERRERLREQERSRTLEDRLAASPKVAEGVLAASARRFGSQYVELQDYERDRAGRETLDLGEPGPAERPGSAGAGKAGTGDG